MNPDSIITVPGVRRAGKSSLLMLAVNKLLASGVKREQILWVNFDDERLSGMQTEELDEVLSAYREMFPDVNLKEVYMFLDEIQNIIGWDLFVLRVFKSYCPHVYVTGSNAKLLSKEISTALRGWTLDYEMLPLSFSEYCRFTSVNAHSYLESDKAKRYAAMENYLHSGAFPQVVLTPDKSTKLKRLQDVRVFSDYEPRNEDSTMVRSIYLADATVEMEPIANDGVQVVYRDRHIYLHGMNEPAEFYQPDYSRRPLGETPVDYRRTLYWNPNARSDENGRFTATFYNNSKETRIKISAAGVTPDGCLMYSK